MEYHYVPALVDNLLLFLVMFIFGYNDILLFFFPFEGRGLKKTKRKQTSRSFTQSILFYSKYPLFSLFHYEVVCPSFQSPTNLILGNFNCSFCIMEQWKYFSTIFWPSVSSQTCTFFSPTSLEGIHVQCNFTTKFRLLYSGLASSRGTNL